MFGINGGEALVLLLVVALVVGPERLPQYTEQLANGARAAKRFLTETKERVGDQAPDVDWAAIDPRRYDPRRIVRDALLEDGDDIPGMLSGGGRPSPGARGPGAGAFPSAARGVAGVGATDGSGTATDAPAPYDDEAT